DHRQREGGHGGRRLHAPHLGEEGHLRGAHPDRALLPAGAPASLLHGVRARPHHRRHLMSLKAFHIFFVIVSTLCALGFGAWAIGDYLRTGNTGVLALGVLGFAAAGALVWYGLWFLRKLKNVSYL